jgi:hypothetical protein
MERVPKEETREMETVEMPAVVVHAYFRLIELNMSSWQPRVAEWLHSEEAEAPLKTLLANVPCSATIH